MPLPGFSNCSCTSSTAGQIHNIAGSLDSDFNQANEALHYPSWEIAEGELSDVNPFIDCNGKGHCSQSTSLSLVGLYNQVQERQQTKEGYFTLRQDSPKGCV